MSENIGQNAVVLAIGTALGWAGNWLLQFRKDGRDASGAAIQALRDTMTEMRTELNRVQKEVVDAKTREEACEARVQRVKGRLEVLENILRERGLPIPQPPPAAAGAD